MSEMRSSDQEHENLVPDDLRSLYKLESVFDDLRRKGVTFEQPQAFLISFKDGSTKACALSQVANPDMSQSFFMLDLVGKGSRGIDYEIIGAYDERGDLIPDGTEAQGLTRVADYAEWIKASVSGQNPVGVDRVNILSVTDETIPLILGFLGINSSKNGTPHESN
jgi:hypothetical protein